MFTGNHIANAIDDSHRFEESEENHYTSCDLCNESISVDELSKLGDYNNVCKECIEMKNSYELFEELTQLQVKIHNYFEVFDKAVNKKSSIIKSEAFVYETFFGKAEREKDLEKCRAVISRLKRRIYQLIIEENKLESKIGFN